MLLSPCEKYYDSSQQRSGKHVPTNIKASAERNLSSYDTTTGNRKDILAHSSGLGWTVLCYGLSDACFTASISLQPPFFAKPALLGNTFLLLISLFLVAVSLLSYSHFGSLLSVVMFRSAAENFQLEGLQFRKPV